MTKLTCFIPGVGKSFFYLRGERYATGAAHFAGRRMFAFSTKGSVAHSDARYLPGDALLFGPETRGLPEEVLGAFPESQRLRVPMREGSRSLNLSNTVAVTVYEAWRQQAYAGAVLR